MRSRRRSGKHAKRKEWGLQKGGTTGSAPKPLRTVGERHTYPLVVRLVQSLVDQRVMQPPVNPINAVVSEDEEAGSNGSVSNFISR